LQIPTGWRRNEQGIARIVSANIKGSSSKDCYNDYLAPIVEDDSELIDFAEEFIEDFKNKQLKEKAKCNG
jgi:hypothetical protein